MLLHRNIVANLLQARAWISPFLGHQREVIITPLPLYHIFSLTANCLTFMTLGGENILIPNPRDIAGFIKEMGHYRFTAFTGVNTLFNALVNNPEFGKLDFGSLRMTLGGGMAVQEAVAVEMEAGHRLHTGRGLRTHRDLAGGTHQSARHSGVQRHDRIADILDRCRAAQRCGQGCPARSARRNLRPRAAGDGRLLESSRRDGEGHDRRRLLHDRRHRRDERPGLCQDRRPQEGHDPRLRLQRVSERDRGRRRDASRRARMRGGRRARREVRRGGQALRREKGRRPDRRRAARVSAVRSSPATKCRAKSSSATSFQKATSARFSGANCATSSRRKQRRAQPFRGPNR